MKCPKCNGESIYVTDTLPADDGHTIYRRKRCSDCDHRFNTIEVTEVEYVNSHMELIQRMSDCSSEKFKRGYYAAYYKKHPGGNKK